MQELNNIKFYGNQTKDITINDIFDKVVKMLDFEKGTIDNSCIKNELFILSDDTGAYRIYPGWIICNINFLDTRLDEWTNQEYDVYSIKNIEELEDIESENHKEFIDCIAGQGMYDEILTKLKEDRNKNPLHYYEVECKKDWMDIYLENKISNDSIYVESDKDGINIEVDGITISSTYEKTMFENLLEIIFLNRKLFSAIQELENGYVFNGRYYEKKDYIISEIYEKIKDKKLKGKFIDEGLTSVDVGI